MYSYLTLLENANRSLVSCQVTFKSLDAYLIKNNVSEKSLSEELIEAWLKTLKCKPQSTNNRIGNLRSFARYLWALEIPAFEYPYVRATSDFIAYTFTDEEFGELIKAADNFIAMESRANQSSYVFPMLLRILYGCGLRISEAINLKWNDINFTQNTITIRKTKNHKQRLIPISNSLADVLLLYHKRQFEDNLNADLLFESNVKHDKPYLIWTFRNWFIKILPLAGITVHRREVYEHTISPHTLRHYFTYKSFLKAEAEGRTLEQTAPFLATYLGHESLLGTEKYITTDYTLYESSQKRMDETIGGLFPEVTFE